VLCEGEEHEEEEWRTISATRNLPLAMMMMSFICSCRNKNKFVTMMMIPFNCSYRNKSCSVAGAPKVERGSKTLSPESFAGVLDRVASSVLLES
jgi:hypothetical protein